MGAPDVLQHLHAVGLHLALSGDKIIVTPRARLTDELRQAIRANREALVQTLAGNRQSRNPLMTLKQAHHCHAGGWDDAEISTFTTRVMLFVRRGVGTERADDVAERLTLRDREHDDRKLCLECTHAQAARRCAAGEMFVADVLQRCPAFEEGTR